MYYIKNHRLNTLFSDSPDYVATDCMVVSKAIAFMDRPLFVKDPDYRQGENSIDNGQIILSSAPCAPGIP